jgi:hypothetical protein
VLFYNICATAFVGTARAVPLQTTDPEQQSNKKKKQKEKEKIVSDFGPVSHIVTSNAMSV